MKRTPEQIEEFRAFNQKLCDKYEDYFGTPSPARMGDVKKALLDECRRVIDATPFGEEMTEANAAVLRHITGWHYDKIRHMPNPKYFTDKRYIEVLQEDGTWITHSWNKTVNPTSEWQDLQKAMRCEVAPYAMSDYRKAAEPICCHCGATEDLAVDHKSRSFDEIMQSFVMVCQGEIAIKDGEGNQGRVLADELVRQAWVAFHDAAADFQMLCRPCNSSKGKKSLQSV